MPRDLITPGRVLALTAAVLVAASQLPASQLRAITGVPTHLLAAVTQPFTERLKQASDTVRGGPGGEDRPASLDDVLAERDRLLQYNEQLRQELQTARQMIAELSQVRQRLDLRAFDMPLFKVTASSADPTSPTLRIAGGSQDGLRPGLVVASGANLAGQISEVGPVSATVSLITRPGTLLEVNLLPAEAGPPRRVDSTVAQLLDDRSGFAAVVGVNSGVAVGDLAQLADSAWPPESRGFVVGEVVDVRPHPDDPTLRRIVVIRPRARLRYLHRVLVLVPADAAP